MFDKIKRGLSSALDPKKSGDLVSSLKDKIPPHLKPDTSQLSSLKDKFKDEIKKKLGAGL